MRSTGKILVVAVMAIASMFSVFADGMFVQSPLYPANGGSSYLEQLGMGANANGVPTNPVLQAIGSADYAVTPGDVYSVSYVDGKAQVSLSLQVDGECRVAIPSIGTVDAYGMTYRQFKAHVEKLISNYYTYSSPQVTLVSCGMFMVRVTGEVSYSRYVEAWGLTRLSDLAVYATDLASTREVQVSFRDGSVEVYDLYKAMRSGDVDNDPILEPGCEVCFLPAGKTVSINGAVKREGTYQVLEGETLNDLIASYALGVFNSADSSSITVANYVDGAYQVKILSLAEASEHLLSDGDSICVGSTVQSMPYVTVSGAIASVAGSSTVSSASKILYSFVPGETAGQLVRNMSDMLLATSDTSSVYVLRDGQKLPVDVSQALSSSEKGDVVLQQGDVVVIPFSQLNVTVTGAVKNSGTFSYVPDRGADYYINLAGGMTTEATGTIKILDKDGNKLNGDVVPADATIVVKRSNLTTELALTASILGIVTSVLNIIIYTHTIATY